ncbi:MAG: hypothetical protein AVDCRST_MAG06-1278 [uncultured Nocardioides sp.]|uniref:Uncharacterized protein n=1 Tax=uncultured Nocardioides sp. TaxID=198441 RepID=A0A6J4NEN8_9ACTN|nr:MAG: hypothetical protein AVDCRST_MAG06-1278 [uncultured Nocardioides sp.]
MDGGLRDPPCLPRSQLAGLDPAPQPGQPVAQLEGLADEPLGCDCGHPEGGAELGHTELRHQRRTRTGDGLLVLTTARRGEGRGGVLGRGVQIGPLTRRHQQLRLRTVRQSTTRTGVAEHRSSGVRELGRRGRHRRTQPGTTDISAARTGPCGQLGRPSCQVREGGAALVEPASPPASGHDFGCDVQHLRQRQRDDLTTPPGARPGPTTPLFVVRMTAVWRGAPRARAPIRTRRTSEGVTEDRRAGSRSRRPPIARRDRGAEGPRHSRSPSPASAGFIAQLLDRSELFTEGPRPRRDRGDQARPLQQPAEL